MVKMRKAFCYCA